MSNHPAHPGAHGHASGHHHHQHQHHQEDMWAGQDYLSRPGVQETAIISADSVIHALSSAGVTESEMGSMHVLEVGCGPGTVTAHLLPYFATIHSIDTSPSMLEAFAKYHATTLSTTQRLTYSLHSLSAESARTFSSSSILHAQSSVRDEVSQLAPSPPRTQFDLVFACLVLHHVDNLDEFFLGLNELLRPGGWVVFTEFGKPEENKEGLTAHTKTTAQGSVNAPDHFHAAFEPDQLRLLLEKHGLVDVHTEFRGTLPVVEKVEDHPSCLIIRARKPMP